MGDPSLSRRELLRRGATGVVGGVVVTSAGCASTVGYKKSKPIDDHPARSQLKPDLPVEERSRILKERIRMGRNSDPSDPKDLKSKLNDRGVDVESVKAYPGLLTLEQTFSTEQARNHGMLADLGSVAGGYLALTSDEAFDALETTVLDPTTGKIGSYSIATEWATATREGSLSLAAYGEKVQNTLKTSH